MHVSGMAASLAQNVVIYTNGDENATESMTAATKDRRLTIEGRKIVSIEQAQPDHPDVLVHLEDGSTRTEAFMVSKAASTTNYCHVNEIFQLTFAKKKASIPSTKLNGSFVDQLSLEVTESGTIKTAQPFYESNVPGVFAVGDCATPFKSVTVALSTGTFAAAGIAARLGQEKF